MKYFSQFPLFQSHIDLAHHYWKSCLSDGDTAIDATCGNGHDTAVLARILFEKEASGKLIVMDKQAEAIDATKKRLSTLFNEGSLKNCVFLQQCHSSFPEQLTPGSVALIIYNLGYLPGGDKSLTTMSPTTHQSLHAAIQLISPGGVISITCYPGHEEGEREELAIRELAKSLDPRGFSCCFHNWINRRKAPSLLLIQKALL